MYLRGVLLIFILSVLTVGCSMREVKQNYDSARNWVLDTEPTASPSHVEDNTPLIELNYAAADQMDSDLWLKLDPNSPIYFKPFTNLSKDNDPAPFGRVVAEQVAARLAQLDRNIVAGEPRADDYATPVTAVRHLAPKEDAAPMADNSTMKDMDSKQDKPPAKEQFRPILPSIMTGTYLLGDDVVFMSAQITTIRDKQLISAYQWTLPINQNTRMLLPQLLAPQRGMTPTVQTRF